MTCGTISPCAPHTEHRFGSTLARCKQRPSSVSLHVLISGLRARNQQTDKFFKIFIGGRLLGKSDQASDGGEQRRDDHAGIYSLADFSSRLRRAKRGRQFISNRLPLAQRFLAQKAAAKFGGHTIDGDLIGPRRKIAECAGDNVQMFAPIVGPGHCKRRVMRVQRLGYQCFPVRPTGIYCRPRDARCFHHFTYRKRRVVIFDELQNGSGNLFSHLFGSPTRADCAARHNGYISQRSRAVQPANHKPIVDYGVLPARTKRNAR